MAARTHRGSIILEILIVVLSILLVLVILVPDKIWQEEEKLADQCRYNLNAVYEAEKFYYRSTESYTDTLENLVQFIQSDSSLQKRRQIAEFTRELYQNLEGILDIPAIKYLHTISTAAQEVLGDLRTNERYFRKYEDLMSTRQEIAQDFNRLESSFEFPEFAESKNFVDSIATLKNEISELPLQKSALYTQRFLDSLQSKLPDIEVQEAVSFWNEEYAKLLDFINSINKTDIRAVSSVADRLKKFADRMNTAFQALQKTDLQESISMLDSWKQEFEKTYQKFLDPSNFIITQRYGLLTLTEVDSILINFDHDNFVCPDNAQQYLVSYKGASLTVECPNLLDEFQMKLVDATAGLKDNSLFSNLAVMDSILDSTRNIINNERIYYRRYTDILLTAKELLAEMDNLKSISFYSYTKDLKLFTDTVQTEKRISVLKPMIEDILVPMDTLAARIETGNISDLDQKIQYFGEKIQYLDSLIANTRLPRRVRKRISKYYPVYEGIYDAMNSLKQNLDPAFAQEIRESEKAIEKALLEVMEGKKERVYLIFTKKHINHGFIKDGAKSWEEES